MKVNYLLEEIIRSYERYGEDFFEWDVYTEQCDEIDKNHKRTTQNWDTILDEEDWEYFKCVGFWTHMINKKIFTINVNY